MTEQESQQEAQAEPEVDHAAMGHVMPEPEPEPAKAAIDHSGHAMPMVPAADPQADHAAMGHDLPATAPPRDPIPAVTPADRTAAFPDVAGHSVHDNSVHSFVLLDRLEAWDTGEAGNGLAWEAVGWAGTDLDRLWVRTEGETSDWDVASADIEVFYGRAIARWWDGVVGIRHDFGDDPSQTFLALGVVGVAPYKFEVEATAYLGQDGQTGVVAEVEYETLFTNCLILQWQAKAELYGKDDRSRGIGSGLGTVEAGLRLRYEFTRKIAPYVGVAWERAYGGTADFHRNDGEDIDDTRLVLGLRTWF